MNLLKRKWFFPYDYWDSFEKFKEGLPRIDKFYNTSTNCATNENFYHEKYERLDYHDLYL